MEKTYQILKLLIWILVFAVILTGAYILYNKLGSQVQLGGLATEAAAEETEAEANPAPDFTLYDAGGNAYKLSDFRGKPVILNFWASWCGPCRSEMPDIDKAYQSYGDQVHFLLVDLTDGHQETVESAAAYIAEEGFTFPVYYDTAIEGAMAYGVSGIPVTYFINAEGNLVAYYQSAMSESILQQGIDMLLNS